MDQEKPDVLAVDELRIILDYYSQHPPPWINNSPSIAKKMKMADTDLKIVEDVLRSLTLAAEHFRNLWDWSEFTNCYLSHNDKYVVWLACQCMSIILQLTESEKNKLISLHMDEQTNEENMLKYNLRSNSSNKDYLKSYIPDPDQYTTVEEVSLSIVGPPKQPSDLILVNSTKQNLRNLSLAVSAGKVACLVGPVGSGKSALVHYLANITGHTDEKLLTVQLGDETDSKMMLGSYHCTDIPGEFVWQPGALTKAVTEGKWLLLEDIDSASSDLAAVLVSLVESRSLTVPGFRDRLIPATGFQLFFTQRVITTTSGYYHKQNIATDLLGKHYIQINVEPLSKNELIEVIEIKFPLLKTIAPKIIDVFLLFSAGFHNSDAMLSLKRNGRLTSTRDLMKWCARIVKEYDVTSSESALKVIQDAIDIFCCSAANPKTRLELACHVASLVGVVKTKAEFFLNEYKPTVVLDEKHCIAGRVTLPRTGSFLTDNDISNSSKFALTRASSCLLERIACSIATKESVLLVGETGTGKTSTLQLLAKHTGNKLTVLNMNQQSDSVDLIGGYKPVELKIIIKPIREEFENLFRAEFNIEQNKKFLGHISTCFNNREWNNLIKLMKHVLQKAIKKNTKNNNPVKPWLELDEKLKRFEVQLKHCQTAMAFAFVEGSLIRAVREGYWVLLDEINLASAETLQCLSSLLESDGTVTIYEKTDSKPISRHPNFRLMAAMNPATDVGKKDLPPGIRNRFTEFFVEELTDRSDLITLTACYLSDYSAQKLNAISKFYLIARREAENFLVDGTGHKPHYSLRTYCRALSIASSNPCQSAQRSLYESFCLSFLTQLDSSSHKRVESLIAITMFGEKLIQGVINQPIPKPLINTEFFIHFEGYWIHKGILEPSTSEKYILTNSVKKNLRDLVRAVSLSCFPVLIQGDTCVGKTSLITYLAAASGNVLVRINNHEHTDLQEYIGSYSAQSITGQLVFKEGVLVEAMRKGHWIVLDELNLAPTDVLEALNRVLDDNRELFIPETQTTIKAHPGFRIFATQNPPGLYGGRKILSRAFKNRFIEMHFDEIPADELETILFQRCEIPLSYSKKVISVMKDLQSTRKGSAAFAGKHGFITLRDLFRWGERYRLAKESDNYDWNQHLVDEGFLVLASKVRKPEEEKTILHVLEKHFKCSLSLDRLFTLNDETSPITRHILKKIEILPTGFKHVYMSKNIRRMVVLACKAIEFNEPILLVGETGCGKTTVCQMIAAINEKKLLTVNCHQHTESSDFLGGLRPVRNREQDNDQRLFEWVDGPLIESITRGHMFLADEISLADDSVLERFNSLLEPERKLLLTEKIGDDNGESELVAHSEFCFVGTMNPGGDYGKKELSPALRNRLTEIWCESCSDDDDLVQIINHNFSKSDDNSLFLSKSMVDFVNWLKSVEKLKSYLKLNITIRDYLIWVKFIESMMSQIPSSDISYNSMRAFFTFYKEGAIMTFLDKKNTINHLYDQAIAYALKDSLVKHYPKSIKTEDNKMFEKLVDFFPLKCLPEWFGYDGYYIPRGNMPLEPVGAFSFDAPTAKSNVIRLLRCMQIENRAILLEGSPGVGKTSLIQAVSKASGHKLTRINLSEQTDVSDLFGADLPTDGGDGGSFEWRDGPFLRALKEGNWILLDELNLASQSVLEGLNAVLDHRGELYIPELGRTFIIESEKTKLFACQNPMSEGGARKGLPKSFLNRFLQVHLYALDYKNIVSIMNTIYEPKITKIRPLNLKKVVKFTLSFCNKYNVDINLRDILRWVDVTLTLKCNILDHLPLIFTDRTANLKSLENEVLKEMRKMVATSGRRYDYLRIFPSGVMFNRFIVPRKRAIGMPIDQSNNKLILGSHVHTLNSLAVCMKMNWMPILVGSGSGKTSVIKTLAQLYGCELRVLSVNAAMDTMEILGGFEQADFNRHLEELARRIENKMFIQVGQQLLSSRNDYISILTLWNEYKTMTDVSNNTVTTMASETKLFKKRIDKLIQIANVYFVNDELLCLLKALRERVCSTGNLNSGGKFEWIDSILVKCLNDGSWLLIDNVNLCSPAVLDRLNGLLEPNGILELGEKGIGSDGQITTITPHENFRLFLAMDPKHGSISRAMKNRGVEIYMGPLDEINNNDIYSMIEQQGICDKSISHTLLKIHKMMKTLISGINISINHLLRTAYLVSQNIKRDQSIAQIIREICIDTYVRCLNENLKQNAILEIDRLLEEHTTTSNEFLFSNLQTIDVLQSSSLSYIKQQCNILKYEHFNNTHIEDLLLCYFGRSSSSDISIRSKLVSTEINIENEAIQNFVKKPPVMGFDELPFWKKSVHHIPFEDLPYDFRYLPSIYFNKGRPLYEPTEFYENKMHLMLDHALYLALDEHLAPSKSHKKRLMIADGGIMHDYAVLSLAFDKYIEFYLGNSTFSILDKDCVLFKEMIIWIHTIEKLLFENLDKEKELITVLIHCYFNIVTKNFLPMLEMSTRKNRHTELERFSPMIVEITNNYLTPKQCARLLKLFISENKLPSPLCCKNHGDKNIEAYRRNSEFISAIKSNNIQALMTPEIKNERDDLLLYKYIECKTIPNYPEELVNNKMNDMELNLIPLWELVIERNFLSRINYSILNEDDYFHNKHYDFMQSLLKFVPTVSPVYCNSLKYNFTVEFLTEALKYSMNSVAVENPKLYLEWSPKKIDNLENHDTINEEMLYSFEQPLFTNFITSILLKQAEPYYTFAPRPIRFIDQNSHNLSCLKSFIWNSSKWTSDVHFENIETLLKLVELFFTPFLPADFSTLEEVHSARDDADCQSAIYAIVGHHKTMVKAIFDIAKVVSHIVSDLHLFHNKKHPTNVERDNLIKQIQFNAGCLWVLSGMCLLEISTSVSPVDPLQKAVVRFECYKAEKTKIISRLNAEEQFCKVDCVSNLFPFKSYYHQRLRLLNGQKLRVGYRPEPPQYNIILEEVNRFSKMYGLESNTYNMINSNSDSEALVNEMDNWLSSVSNFHNNLNEKFAAYPDLLTGILLSINQMRYGMRMLKNHYKWSIPREKNVTSEDVELLTLFGEFPRYCPDIIKMTNMDDAVSMNISDKFRWYKLCLEELNNMMYLSSKSYRTEQYMKSIEYVLEKFVFNWKRFQEEEENKKREEDSIYKQKSFCETIPEEIEISQGVALQFPTTKHSDFDDIEGPLTLDNDIPMDSVPQEIYKLTDKDINDICRLHTDLVRPAANAHWLSVSSEEFDQKNAIIRVKNSFSDRFCMFGKLLMSKFMYLDSSMDSKMLPWLLMATDIANNPKQLDTKGYYDFYRDSNLEYAKKTYEVLKNVEDHIQKLLHEWPDHPTLQTIIKVVERIMNFDWSSPTCRFLIGLELLLTKLHEWEEVAHRGVSVRELKLTVTHYIQEYRSLELSTWKDCLKTSLKKIQNDSSKWWFHLYSIFQAYLHRQDSFQQLVTAVQKFMESSSLGQYLARLELLYTFHCDIICREKTKEQIELCSASWNLYKYYSQFKDCINLRIETLSADTKKKLQDFVKIVKWNDINYWSIKETVTKVQQTLHKYTREYEEILNNPASFAMTTQTEILSTKTDKYEVPIFKIDNYLENCEIFLYILPSSSFNILTNINKYSKKLFTISGKIMTNCGYSEHITELNDFVNGVMESSQELRDLNVDPESSKDKQKSQAKQILQQKRKALSELFKALRRIGLSYKAGLMGCEQMDCSIEFARLPPIDINAALESLTPNPADNDLRCAWSDCESYFLKSVSQTTALKIASETPKLGQQEMDRIKGFINDLKNMTWKTRKILASHIECLVNIRSMTYLSEIITESDRIKFDPSEVFQQPVNYMINSLNLLQQLKIALQCGSEYIDSTSTDSMTSLLGISPRDSEKEQPSEEIATNVDDIIKLTHNTLDSIIDEKTYNAMKLCDINFIVYEKYDASILVCEQLMQYINRFYKTAWINNIHSIKDHQFERQPFVSDDNEPPLEEINSLINQVLLAVEKLYKKHSDIKEDKEDEKLLKSLITQPLSSDLEDCDIISINKQLKKVLKSSIGSKVLRTCRPIFEQYTLLVQYFITQQTTVYRVLSKMNYLLSTLFTDLASNGFCIPDELLEGEDGTQSDGKSGMGLTDGEGAKDVSDQIESQDQLEDAKKDYNNEAVQDKDLKEEEKGVEMSDDFDGKLHDMDKDENEVSDDENNEEDNDDKEMGETGEGAETLDEKLWGSDSEDDNCDEQEDLKEEDGKGGETMGDKELGAKNDNDNVEEQDKREEIDQKNSKKDINEMDENGEETGEDHTDPHHGDLQPPPEPEPIDLPNDLQLDEGEMNDTEEGDENPFDIDAMKENMENAEIDEKEPDEKPKDTNDLEDTSDEEMGDENKIDDTKATESNEELEETDMDDDTNNDGGKKDENKTGEEPKEENKNQNDENAKPSEDDPSQAEVQPSNLDNGGSKDQVCENSDGQDKNEEIEFNKEEATGPEQQGVGQSQRESKDTKGGHSVNEDRGAQSEEPGSKDKKRRMKPGEKDMDRTLAESNGPMKKRLKTTDTQDENSDNENGINDDKDAENKKGELFKHVKESKDGDTETLDAATTEQLEERPLPNNENQPGEELKDDEMEIEQDVNENDTKNGDEILPERMKTKSRNNQSSMNDPDNSKDNDEFIEEHIDVDGEDIPTHFAERGQETTFHTADIEETNDVDSTSIKDHNEYIRNQFDKWLDSENKEIQTDEAWNKCMHATSSLAQELSEQLRLVLEPSKASRLQGDFRTGRRINMRRVIPYIASQFKKDKIWLRRTRPSKRQYQIIMAVDNSSSMMDSHAKILAFESLALVSKALTLVEAGELGVMSFGEQTKIVHPLGEPFSDQTGCKLMQHFTFDEQKTKVGELIELATAVFEDRGKLDTGDQPAQLLVIMSDGRGIKSEGPDVVKNAIRAAKVNGIFIVFIVIDNPKSKESILDIKMPIFENNSVRIESYMDNFPFPFYVILRDVDKLPGVLSDALREWFELITT
ncbi:midasin [Metopolophium dirhodum]|uniref:midasin n=1 Tax=Metopolophium dirhodum TaxID=44670 RepID=UPI0029906BB0|nr:midasin [Metopolophium dirhodum]